MIFARLNKFIFALLLLFASSYAISTNWNSKNALPPKGRPTKANASRGSGSSQKGLVFSTIPLFTKDTLKKAINREANRASLMSAILPGLGQAYNKKYWKVPVVYAALGGIGYFAWKFNNEYQNYHNELLFRYSHNQQTNSFPSNPPKTDDVSYTTDQLIILKNQSKKYRDLCIIGMGIVYVLNIIDANVDGHLKKFDVDDNLTLSVAPRAMYCMNSPHLFAPGISLALHFK